MGARKDVDESPLDTFLESNKVAIIVLTMISGLYNLIGTVVGLTAISFLYLWLRKLIVYGESKKVNDEVKGVKEDEKLLVTKKVRKPPIGDEPGNFDIISEEIELSLEVDQNNIPKGIKPKKKKDKEESLASTEEFELYKAYKVKSGRQGLPLRQFLELLRSGAIDAEISVIKRTI